MNDIDYIEGLFIKEPVTKQGKPLPDFIKAKGSIKVADLMAWLKTCEDEWVNFDVKVSKKGKWYCAVDNWKPEQSSAQQPASQEPPFNPDDDDIPF